MKKNKFHGNQDISAVRRDTKAKKSAKFPQEHKGLCEIIDHDFKTQHQYEF
jgi:hypothetical protein